MNRSICRRGSRGSDNPFQRAYDGNSSTLRDARSDVIGWLIERGFEENLRDRAALVLSELATNAVQASPGVAYNVDVRHRDDHAVIVTVTSRTAYEQPPPREHWTPTDTMASRGRGLMIVDELADDVEVELRNRHIVVVTATLRPSAPPESRA